MRYRWLPFALLFLCCLSIAAQQPLDSLNGEYQKAFHTGDHTQAGITLTKIGNHFYFLPQRDTAYIIFHQALRLNTKVKNDSMVGFNLNSIGSIHLDWGNFDSALYYYEEAITLFERSKDTTRVAVLKTNLGKILREKGAYSQALDLFLSAARIFESKGFMRELGQCYNSIAITYRLDHNYLKAAAYNKRALVVRLKTGDREGVAATFNNLGNVYVDSKKYDSALYYFNRSLEIRRELNNIKGTSSTLHNIGDVFINQGKVDSAKVYYNESLLLKRETGDRPGEIVSLLGLADCEIMNKRYTVAGDYLHEASVLEIKLGGLPAQRQRILELLVRLSRAIGEYKRASDYAEELFVLKDSLLSVEKTKEMAGFQTAYEVEIREQKIEILNQEYELNQAALKSKNIWIAALIIAVTSTLVIVVLVYNSFRLARNGRMRVETLMKELHHRVKNNLQVLSSVLSLQSQHLTDEQALLSVKSTEGRINAMALIHRKLYSDDTSTIVSTRGYFRELIEFLVSSYGFNEDTLTLNVDIDEVELDVDKAIPLGLIANELISNAFKHAYVKQQQPQLTIQLKQYTTSINLVVQDNGSGVIEQQSIEETKFGMRMVNILVKDLKGKYTTHTENGTTHILTIPLA